VHAGGAATGAEIERALVDAVRATAIAVYERWFALDFLVEQGACHGVIALDESGTRTEVRAANVLVATGGAGQLYAVTTNPAEATGDGVAMALRAGAAVADTEFIQFHPTALHHPAMPRPLLSEALRGHGAKLRDAKGEQFVDELLPRDKVSKAMTARMLEQGIDHLWLDATELDDFNARFPTIAAALREAGLDPAKDWLPIAPAAHYFCGGIVADLDGASSLPGLWAAGETACNGVHGANRLASNSLLDGMVFAPRIVEAIERGKTRAEATGAMRAVLGAGEGIAGRRLELDLTWDEPASVTLDELQASMTRLAAVLRSADSLDEARAIARRGRGGDDVKGYELRNLSTVAQALIASALAREESRGAHIRIDNPDTDEALRLRFVVR
jgi:L-aspartate oxidase